MPGSPRIRGISSLVTSRVTGLRSGRRRIQPEPVGAGTKARAGSAQTLPPLPPDAAGLAEEAASFLAQEMQREGRDGHLGQRAYRLLLPYTDSESAERALETVAELPFPFTAEVCVLHLTEWATYGRGGRFFFETPEESVSLTRCAVEKLRLHGLEASGLVQNCARGRVPSEVVVKANELSANAIVVGARRRPLITAALFGSVSLSVVRHAKCPVILVHSSRRHLEPAEMA